MSKNPIEYIQHIHDECSFIISVTDNLSKDEFIQNETLKRAIERSLEIIGEPQKKFRLTIKLP